MRFFENFHTFVSIGPISIQWYAIVILTGAVIAYLLGQYRFKQLGYDKEILSDYFFALLFIGIIGMEIYCAFRKMDALKIKMPHSYTYTCIISKQWDHMICVISLNIRFP